MSGKAEAMRVLERKRAQLDGAALNGASAYTDQSFGAGSFTDWLRMSAETNDPDFARAAIYFGFQPLLDLLIEKKDGWNRAAGIRILDRIVEIGVTYLSRYYTGRPDVAKFKSEIGQLKPEVEKIAAEPYRKKPRNIDFNSIYPKDISTFLKTFIDYCIEDPVNRPDYIIACACGSSEIAMPLAGFLGEELDFIRRSHRRGDDAPRVVREHEPRISDAAKGSSVLCIDDYLCTGRSLQRVMAKAKSYGASFVFGASIRNSMEGNYLKQ